MYLYVYIISLILVFFHVLRLQVRNESEQNRSFVCSRLAKRVVDKAHHSPKQTIEDLEGMMPWWTASHCVLSRGPTTSFLANKLVAGSAVHGSAVARRLVGWKISR